MAYQAPKGTRDVTPAESYRWQYVEALIRDLTARCGFKEIRTPVIEPRLTIPFAVFDTHSTVGRVASLTRRWKMAHGSGKM